MDDVRLGVAPGALDQPGVGLHPQDRAGPPRQGQGEVAQTTEEVQDPLLGTGVEEVERLTHHEAVQFQINLGEVGGQEV